MRKKVNKKEASPPAPLLSPLSSLNEQRPLVLQGEESDMSSNYILFELYLQDILLPSLFGEGLGRGFVFLVLLCGGAVGETSFLSHLLAE